LSELKKILISWPDSLLREVDSFTGTEKQSRSEFVREAMKLYIKERKKTEINALLKKGYVEMGDINLKIAELGLEADNAVINGYEAKLAECE
jgi:CopG family transcriptional regulator/antitoxin EndoAI